jgi:hypothetical protein
MQFDLFPDAEQELAVDAQRPQQGHPPLPPLPSGPVITFATESRIDSRSSRRSDSVELL